MENKELIEKKNKIENLLKELNYWVQQGGDKNHRPENLKSSGESNSSFQNTMEKLLQLGVEVEWNKNEYIITDKRNENSTC